MKRGSAKGEYIRPLLKALEGAGYELGRRSTSHFIMKSPGRPNLTVPQKLDDIGIAKRIAKAAGVSL